VSAEAAATLHRRVAIVLRGGTWLASAVVCIGLVLPSGAPVVMTGIALFIALPIVRVIVMLVEFLRRRDYRIAVIAALVLHIIVLGIALGVLTKVSRG
jgi:uncharacterized membrane protein